MKKVLLLFFMTLLTACSSTQEIASKPPVATSASLNEEKPSIENVEKPAEPQKTEQAEPTVIFEKPDPITLTFAGDTMMAGRVAGIVERKGMDYPFTDAAPIFQDSDLTMVNLETPLSKRGSAKDKEYTYRSDPRMAEALKKAGVDIVTVANNHALDYGIDAFLDTFDFLNQAGVSFVGGGKNTQEAYSPVTVEVKGKKVSVFGFSRVLAEANWHAGKDTPGMASAYDPELVYQAVEPIIGKSDYTIVLLHWGKELAEEPLPYQVELAHGLIDRGVDLVIGSHPHVLQGLEWYKDKLIAYSLGNFIFTTSRVAEGRQSGILKVSLLDDVITPEFIPMFIEGGAVHLATGVQKEEIMQRLERLSKEGNWKEGVFEKSR
ncbi:CapA family protein [Ammoniphilus resinae]|uniref:Poly-gamma-glutamate synthesis protein (Capsule biosynthesis protein) n=1 Tax=Ammoniphilus resinae TaxID=861532 RepID=A0ABS4GS01_9BACL|nr:CapA family protein [Ammoniphilus resinae]MBP1932907.1 poly-gamma-glutamate synthesis protein (capsule biosynthesis protein) [Ammoniphilus resinae]